MATNPRSTNRTPGKPVGVSRPVIPGEHYGKPIRPYVRGTAPKLSLCDKCECFMPPDHTCSGETRFPETTERITP